MNHPLITPNWHVILIHYPLALFFIGLVIELASVFWRTHPVRAAGGWMILLGGLSLIPATLSGIYALHDVALIGNHAQTEAWAGTVASSPLTGAQWTELVRHVWLMSIATGLVVTAIVGFLAMSDRLRRKLYAVVLVLLLAGAGVMGVGAWFAGEAIYRLGVAIELPEAASAGQAAEPLSAIEKINTLFPPIQTHVVFAGFAVAVALAAVGLSIRSLTRDLVEPERLNEADSLVQSLHPPVVRPGIYPARFWVAAAVVFILTALLGWYFFGSDAGTFNPKKIWPMAMSNDSPEQNGPVTRIAAHVWAAATLVLLPLVLAILTKWAPRQKTLLAIFTAILLAVIAAQLWIGILLLFDGSTGRLTGFLVQ